MTWVEAQYLYVVIAIYVIAQIIIDIFTNKIDIKKIQTPIITIFTGYLISIPVLIARWGFVGFRIDIPLFLCLFR